jgi:hypothetical protein
MCLLCKTENKDVYLYLLSSVKRNTKNLSYLSNEIPIRVVKDGVEGYQIRSKSSQNPNIQNVEYLPINLCYI